ncbi:hypothetical protein [Bosea thiooxidans]
MRCDVVDKDRLAVYRAKRAEWLRLLNAPFEIAVRPQATGGALASSLRSPPLAADRLTKTFEPCTHPWTR